MKVKKINLLELIIYLFPISFQFSNITGRTYYYITYVLLMLVFFLSSYRNKLRKNILKLFSLLLLAQLVVPLFSGFFEIKSFLYCMFMILFLLDSYIFGIIFNDSEDKVRMIRNLLISNSIILLIQVLRNVDAFNTVSFMTVFNNSRSNRAYFGFSHPNFAAVFMVTEVILCYIYSKTLKGKKRLGMFIILTFWIMSICLTGSRSALYCVIIFLGYEIVEFMASHFPKIKKLLTVLFFIVAIFFVWYMLGSKLIENYNVRAASLFYNFNTIVKSGRLLLGSGGLPTSQSVIGIEHSDNWYMTTIINTGLVGMILYAIMIIPVFIDSIKRTKQVQTIPITALIIMLLAYSFGENVLFIPGVELSWLFWCLLMSVFLSRTDSEDIKERGRKDNSENLFFYNLERRF